MTWLLGACMGSASGGEALLEPVDPPLQHSRRIEGLQASWGVRGEELVVELDASTTGWMVVGFNDRDHIVGADLTFARVVEGRGELFDHHVFGVGDHRPHGNEGRLLAHAQREGRTALRFALPLKPAQGRALAGDLWLVLAWSVSPDLDHHSRVRRHVQIRL
ncbi:MAG: hypothetical protein KTR31_04750 [Myxococcales bacterium]|nr:hypothetical protein [Myxococcales bacterium]